MPPSACRRLWLRLLSSSAARLPCSYVVVQPSHLTTIRRVPASFLSWQAHGRSRCICLFGQNATRRAASCYALNRLLFEAAWQHAGFKLPSTTSSWGGKTPSSRHATAPAMTRTTDPKGLQRGRGTSSANHIPLLLAAESAPPGNQFWRYLRFPRCKKLRHLSDRGREHGAPDTCTMLCLVEGQLFIH